MKTKTYKIRKTVSAYSKKFGTVERNYTLEKDLTLENALVLSFEKYGNTNKEMNWRNGDRAIYPSEYSIK